MRYWEARRLWREGEGRSALQRAAFLLACTRRMRGTRRGGRLLDYAYGISR